MSLADVAAWLGAELDRDPAEVADGLAAVCRTVHLFPAVVEVVARVQLPQALVKINPDVFREHVVPCCGLDDLFDEIVVSCEVGSLQKADVCDVALDRLGLAGRRDEALLIDDIAENVDAWRALGGTAYLFITEEQLGRDLSGDPLAQLVTPPR